MKYACECCNFNTDRSDNYKVHLNSKKHFKKSNPLIEENNFIVKEESIKSNTEEIKKVKKEESKKIKKENKKVKKEEDKVYICDKCFLEYKYRQSLCRHKKNCNGLTKNSNENINTLVNKLREEIKELKKEKKANESKNITIYNNTTNNIQNIQNNIVIVPYTETDIDHLTEDDLRKIIKKNHTCVKELVSRKHFNKNKPEYMNLAVTNIHDKYMLVYRDGWGLTKKEEMIDTLFEENEQTIEGWVSEINDPELKEKFDGYKIYISNDIEKNSLKEDLIIHMYNQTMKLNIGKK